MLVPVIRAAPGSGRVKDGRGVHLLRFPNMSTVRRAALIGAAALALGACAATDIPKQLKPVPSALVAKMDQLGMKETGRIFIRIFKETSELEVWKERRDGQYALLKTYEICKWSGNLGPKLKEGDRQAPEGFYTVTPAQMNPKSDYYLSFNIGYPNTFDRSHGRTGAHLMVHGACSSAGCYSMTDDDAGEIFGLARDAFKGGQRAFQIQAFPFRMTAANFARHRDNPNMTFWTNLKEGYEHFELTKQPPKVDVCDRRYVFNATATSGKFSPTAACPAYTVPARIGSALATRLAEHERDVAAQVAKLQSRSKPEAAASATPTGNFLTRMLNRGEGEPAATPLAQSQTAASFAAEAPGGAAPLPALRPTHDPVVTGSVQQQPEASPASGRGIRLPSVGRLVKREFWWPEG